MTRETNMTLIRDALEDIDFCLRALQDDRHRVLTNTVERCALVARLRNARSFLRTISI